MKIYRCVTRHSPTIAEWNLVLKDVRLWDLQVAAPAEEEMQRICSHVENSTSNHTGKEKKTLHGGVGVSKVMSTHSERGDFLYLISTGHSGDSPALIWCHVSRILNSQKNISHSEGARRGWEESRWSSETSEKQWQVWKSNSLR